MCEDNMSLLILKCQYSLNVVQGILTEILIEIINL